MNLHAIPNFLVAILMFMVGLFVVLRNKKSRVHLLFFLSASSASIWQIGTALALLADNSTSALTATRVAFFGIALIPVLSYHLSLCISGAKINKILIFGYLCAFLCFIPLSWTPLILNGVYKYSWGYFFKAGKFHPVFMVFFIYFMGLIFFNLFLSFRKETKPFEKNRKKYFSIALLIAYIGSIDYLPTYGVKVYPFGYLTLICFVLIFAYAILRYRLLDIKVALTRTSIFVMVYTLVLGLPFAVSAWFKRWLIEMFGASWWILPQGLTALLATAGPFLYIYLDRQAENRLLKEQKRYQATLKQASVGMTRIRNLKRLLDLITHIVTKTVKISYIGIYLYNKESDEYILQVNRDKGRMPPIKITISNPLITWLKANQEPLVYEEIKRLKEDSHELSYQELEENMRLLFGTVVIPSLLEDRLLALIVLGEKTSGQIYTPEDLNVFQVLAAQAALAIENAHFFEEAKQMQEQIAQAEKMATVGTMADGMSHQINNRFYALSLIAGDTIDTIKLMDTSKCTPEVKEIIDSVRYALERINDNVIQGGQIVKGLLKYTRKGDEGLEPVTLDEILDGTLAMVQFKVNLADVDILRNYLKDTPKIKGNSTQLQEVFFNFIDNAYDAIVERKTLLKEEGFRGKIAFSVQPRDNILEITIEDNGLGIKDTDSNKVFTPFFTTKTSSRKGTGLGLYVVRRVIEEFHKGKISFTSTYGKGTTFIVELPIAKE